MASLVCWDTPSKNLPQLAQRLSERRLVYSALLPTIVVFALAFGALPAKAQGHEQILTVNLREWAFLPVYDAGDLRGVLAYRKTGLKKFDVLWFDRRETGWAPFVYKGHDLPCAVALAESQFLNQGALHADVRLAPAMAGYDPAQETAEFAPATNGLVSLHFKATASEDGSFPGVFIGSNPDGVFGAATINLRSTAEDCCDTARTAMIAAGNEQTTDGVAPALSWWLDTLLSRGAGASLVASCLPWWSWTVCTPWAAAGPPAWVFISSTPAAGNIHCNYERQQPETRTCTRTTNFCWWTWTTTWTESRTVVLESRTCTVESPGPCPPTPGC